MKNLFYVFILFYVYFSPFLGFSQEIPLLSRSHTQDTIEINTLNAKSFKLRNYEIDEALRYAQKAYLLSQKTSYQQGEAESLGLMGLIFYRKGLYNLAIDNHFKSLEIYEKLNNKRFIAYRYNDIANVYIEQKIYVRAIDFYEKSMALKKEIKDIDGIATTYKNLANLYISKKKYGAALYYIQQALDLMNQNEKKVSLKIKGDIYASLSEIYNENNQLDSAIYYADKSEDIKLSNKDFSSLSRVYRSQADIAIKKNKYSEGLALYQKGITNSEKYEMKSELLILNQSISKFYESQNQYKEAFYYTQIANSYKDSIFSQ
jgi:tetratricopeptide (TPR) repeat protein